MNAIDLKTRVIEPVLRDAHLYSEAAVNLILGTAAQESHMGKYFVQINGPAVGVFQMEPATHDDIWQNFLAYQGGKRHTEMLRGMCGPYPPEASNMFWHLRYAALMCRVHYLRKPHKLPDADDIEGLGAYWKVHYNTHLGKGTIDEFVENYRRFVLA